MQEILLSIITIAYNCENEIKKTFMSLNSQLKYIDCSCIEYLIIDGKSQDNTVSLANEELKYLNKLGVKTKIISEADNGIYDAMNKGLNNASGKWVYMLNSGDIFFDDSVLSSILPILKDEYDLIYGNTLRVHSMYTELWIPGSIDGLKNTMIVCHQSVFIKREQKEHYYDLSYRFCADYDLILRLYLSGKVFYYLDKTISRYSLDGVTATSSMVKAYDEIYQIKLNHGIIQNNFFHRLSHTFGKIKRYIIILLPQKLRWKITKIIHSHRKCNS